MIRKKIAEITMEASELINGTHQLVRGDLDLSIQADDYIFLRELADNINQIGAGFNGYIDEISHILSHLSAGNMAVSFNKDIVYQGDFLPIKNALHKIRRSLNSSFEEIGILSKEVDKLCSQVKEGSSLIAKNTSEQADFINDLTNTVYRITEQTSNNAVHAKDVSESVFTIQNEAVTGNNYMDQMMVSIQEVKVSSNDISNIITIISEIARRTKLLALNAAIEAAHAGDSGRGFSVVASEIGILAEKSSDAVKQTTCLIEQNIRNSEASVHIANKTSESFHKISNSINQVAKLCSDIADVSVLQAEELQNTSSIITDISKAVQESASYARENSSIVIDLTHISTQLTKVMTRFQLKDREHTSGIDNDEINRIDNEFLKKLIFMLQKVYLANEIDLFLNNLIKERKDFECLYVIDDRGYQISHTIMNPDIIVEQDDNFKPAMPGDYHGSKKYFRQAIKAQNKWYISSEYISAATGGLCRTFSCSYMCKDKKPYAICIDIMYK